MSNLRGGSWYNYPIYLRTAYRSYFSPEYRYYLIGFRCARDAESPALKTHITIRGGTRYDTPYLLRLVGRGRLLPGSRDKYVGFRCAA